MIFDGIDTLYEAFYAYVESVVDEEAHQEAKQPEPVEAKSGWTWEEEEISRHSTVLLAS
ncbi:hypothetical protein KSD_32090 [Ktedonobacter sp. SOSP1-85]|nr:hypothetical protein KSD_32090 [Ktedonobacter sp. SOSP1-85]